MSLTNQPVTQKKPRPTAADKRAARIWIDGVRELPCVICRAGPPSTPHHVIHGRYSQRRPPDNKTIPMCDPCHREIHAGKQTWAMKYGYDHEYLAVVADMLAGE